MMNDLQHILGTSLSKRAIEELTMVKTTLQEKDETIDQQELAIRRLTEQIRRLEDEVFRAGQAVNAPGTGPGNGGAERGCSEEHELAPLVEDLVRVLARHEKRGGGYGPISGEHLVSLLEQKYGLRVIDGPVDRIDPRFHHVVEVKTFESADGGSEHGPGRCPGVGHGGAHGVSSETGDACGGAHGAPGTESIVPLARGYVLGDRVIRPLQVRVVRGGGGPGGAAGAEGREAEAAAGTDAPAAADIPATAGLTLVQDRPWDDGPGGAA